MRPDDTDALRNALNRRLDAMRIKNLEDIEPALSRCSKTRYIERMLLPNWARWAFGVAAAITVGAVVSFLFQSNWGAAGWAAMSGGWQLIAWFNRKVIDIQAHIIERLKNQPVVIEGVLFDIQDHCN